MTEAKNRFERGIETRNARLGQEAASAEARAQRNQAQRDSWVSHGRPAPTTGGVRPDAGVLAAKKAFENYKAAAKAAVVSTPETSQISEEDMLALLDTYVTREADFHPSEFNLRNLVHFVLHNVASRKLTWSLNGIRTAARFLAENNYFEPADGVRRRGQPAALEVPQYIPPKPAEKPPTIQQLMRARRTVIPADEYRALHSMPLNELEAIAQKRGNR